MKIKVTHEVVYDTDDNEFMHEFLQYMDDHPLRFSGFEEFIKDRFINPNFDKGNTSIEILPLTKCARCDSVLSFDEVSDNYYAYCPQHDEDLDKWECK